MITGALTGIGRATASAFATEGARVVVSGRHEEEGQRLIAELRELGAEAEFLRADVRREDDVRGLVDKAVARFGRLDAAVNNAGTEGTPGPVTEQSAEVDRIRPIRSYGEALRTLVSLAAPYATAEAVARDREVRAAVRPSLGA